MIALFLLLGLPFSGSAAPSSLFTKTACQSTHVVLNASSPWILTETLLADNQFCTYTFSFPEGYFAVASVLGTQMNPDGTETVHIYDSKGSSVLPQSYTDMSSTLPWGQEFSINVQSSRMSSMKVAASIMLQKNLLLNGAAPSQQISIHTNGPSPVIYPQDLRDGQIISISSVEAGVVLKPAAAGTSNVSLFQNIFVYSGTTFLGTALSIMSGNSDFSVPGTCLLYVAMAPAGLKDAAVLVLDSTNLVNLKHYVSYVAVDQVDGSGANLIEGDSQMGAVTLIGAKDGSNEYDATDLSSLDQSSGYFSYISGGPQASHSTDHPLNPRSLPQHFTGNANTFYISQGEGVLRYTLT